MNNPYEKPHSDLGLKDELKSKRSIWWKIYFFIITILAFLGMLSYLLSPGSGTAEILELILLTIATAGLYGFVFSKKILFAKFWIPFLVVYVASDFIYSMISNVDLQQGMGDQEYYISYVFGLILSLPSYYGLYKYGNADAFPWKNAQ